MVVRANLHGKPYSPNSVAWTLELKRRDLFAEVSKNGAPRCQRIEFSAGNVDNPKVAQHELHEFSDYSDDAIPDEEFTLSYYGLPEPVGMEAKARIPNYVWFLIGAALFGLLAFVLRYSVRRRTTTLESGAKL